MGTDMKANARLVFGVIENHFSKTDDKLFFKDINVPVVNKNDIDSVVYSIASRGQIIINQNGDNPYIEKLAH